MSDSMHAHEPARSAPILNWPLRLLFGALGAAAIGVNFIDDSMALVVLALCLTTGLATAGTIYIVRSRSLDPDERRAWRLFGLGMLIATVGLATFNVVWLIDQTTPVFGPVDFIWLAGYSLGITGLAIIPHASKGSWHRLRLLLDGAIGAIAIGALIWTLSLQDLTSSLRKAGVWEGFVGSAYVLLDASVLIVLMIVVVRRSTYRFDMRLVLIGLAAIAQGVGDYVFLTSGLGRSFSASEPFYTANILAVMLFLGGAVIVDRRPKTREYAERATTPWRILLLPYSSAVAMVVLLFSRTSSNATATESGLLYATVLVAFLVIGRQAVAIRENRRLVEDQRTDLVSSISHELRTPLTSIVGFLELLDVDAFEHEAERKEVTSIVNQQASYLGRIVSDLVMLASDTITTMELEVAATSVDAMAWSAVNAAAIDPSLVRVDAEQDVTAFLDEGRMQQALANLLGNAVRYGGEKVTVVARRVAGDLILEVHDDGPGVPRRYELLIWEKFERGPNRLNATVPGSGIGLAVTNAIAKAHGGAAGYRRSERLGGACFWIRLPGRVREERPTVQPDTVTPFKSSKDDDAQTA